MAKCKALAGSAVRGLS